MNLITLHKFKTLYVLTVLTKKETLEAFEK